MSIPPQRRPRRFTRIPHDGEVRILGAAGQTGCGQLLDISLNGALVSRPAAWTGECGDRFELRIQLGGAPFHIAMHSRVAHLSEDRIGFECRHIDLDSVAHLRRLLELNLGEEQLLGRELGELLALNTPPGPRSDD